MFLLPGHTFPSNSAELAALIRKGVSNLVTLPAGVSLESAVVVEAREYPTIDRLTFGLDDAFWSATTLPSKPVAASNGVEKAKLFIQNFTLSCRPFRSGQARMQFGVDATNIAMTLVPDTRGRPLLMLSSIEDALIEGAIGRADLNAFATSLARAVAKSHGVDVEEVTVDLRSEGSNLITVEVRVRVRKMLVGGTLRVTGKLTIDNELRVTTSGLAVQGEGVIGTMAAGVLRPKLKTFEGRLFSLVASAPGALSLPEFHLRADDDGVRIRARVAAGASPRQTSSK